MKKMIASLFASLLLIAPVLAQAQGVPTQYYANAVGTPAFVTNSGGTQYGQLCSNAQASPSSFSLGYGTAQATCGTPALTWDNTPAVTANAPVVLKQTQFGTAPGGSLGVYTSSTVPNGTSFVVLMSSGAGLAFTSTPTISTINSQGLPIASGTLLVVSSTQTITIGFQDNSSVSGTLLKTYNAAISTVNYQHTIEFIFSQLDGFWHQIGQ